MDGLMQAVQPKHGRPVDLQGDIMTKDKPMKKTAIVLAPVAAFGLTAIASTSPAEARRGFGSGIAGGLIAGATIAGAAASAYAWAPRPVYGPYDGYAGGPGYYYGNSSQWDHAYASYGDQSEHSGQPSYGD
jgi:hypothetical protein